VLTEPQTSLPALSAVEVRRLHGTVQNGADWGVLSRCCENVPKNDLVPTPLTHGLSLSPSALRFAYLGRASFSGKTRLAERRPAKLSSPRQFGPGAALRSAAGLSEVAG
jgi:hypothetical protein